MIRNFFAGILILLSFGSCVKNKCGYDACAKKAPAGEIQAVRDYLSSKGITNAIEHCSGLFYVVDDPGTGKAPNGCSQVSVHYKGSLTNGKVFDERDYSLSLDGVISGWRAGIPLIKSGGRIRLYVPPSLGYGSQAMGPIPANSILIFEVKLFSVQ